MSSEASPSLISPSHRARLIWLAVLLLLVGYGLRLVRLDVMPLYLDEATHITWAERLLTHGEYFGGASFNKMLYPLILAPLGPSGPEAPFLGRMIGVWSGLIALSSAVALGRVFGGTRAALLAGLLYAALPFAVFHERQALVDPLMAAFTTLSLLLMVHLARRPRVWLGLLLGAVLIGAYLTKISALPFLLLGFVAVLLLARRRSDLLRALLLCVLALLMALVARQLVYDAAEAEGIMPIAENTVTLAGIRLFHLADPDIRSALSRDIWNAARVLWSYAGPVIIALALLSLVWAIRGDRRRAFLFLLIPAVGFIALPVLTERFVVNIPGRYLLHVAAPLTVLAALSLDVLLSHVERRWPRAGMWLLPATLAGFLLPSLWFATLLIRDVAEAPLTSEDRHLYVVGFTAGYAYKEAAADLLERWEAGERPLNTLTYGGFHWQTTVHLGPRIGEHYNVRPGDAPLMETVSGWLSRGEPVYLMETAYTKPGSLDDFDLRLERVSQYEFADSRVDLWRVAGVEGDLASLVYENLVPPPDKLADAYDALAADLLAAGEPRPTIVFPAHHADALIDRGVEEVIPWTPDSWPFSLEDASRTLTTLDLGTDGRFVEVIQVDPLHLNPERSVSGALARSLYPIRETLYDLLTGTTYVTGPLEPPLSSVDAEWESAIDLPRAAIVDRTVRAGSPLRIALEWQTQVPVQDPFKVFVHVFDASGSLITQYDSEPGGGYLPMTGWEVGKPVQDRFAIVIPAGTPPGDYTLRLGLVHPYNGWPLTVTKGSPSSTEWQYVILGTVTVVSADQ